MKPEKFHELFTTRKSKIRYFLTGSAVDNFGWVGGNAPQYFDDKVDMVSDPDRRFFFYLTMLNPVDGTMLSVFIPDDFSFRLSRNHHPCAVKVFAHDVSPESDQHLYELVEDVPGVDGLPESLQSDAAVWQANHDWSKPVLRKTYLSKKRGDSPPFLQVGGKPKFLQHEDSFWAHLHDEGYSFFCCADEDGYPDETLQGNYPFSYGAVYFYAKIGDTLDDIIAGFWQYS